MVKYIHFSIIFPYFQLNSRVHQSQRERYCYTCIDIRYVTN